MTTQTVQRRRILVTGGAGFIGSHLVDRLVDEGTWSITVLDNFDPYYDVRVKRANVEGFARDPHVQMLEADIRDRTELERRVEGPFDVVVHLAARAGVRPSLEDPQGYTDTNVTGTQNLLEAARAWQVETFVFASSSSVYGIDPDVPWSEEHAVLRPISPYAATKVSGELLGHVYAHLYGLRFVALRFFTVYGPRQRPDLAIHKFARRMLRGDAIPVYGDGSSRRDYTYIDDVLDGVRAAIDYDARTYDIINLGNDRTVSLDAMIAGLERVLDVPARIDRQPEQPGDVPQTWADIDRARERLGYEPQIPFDEGLARFAAWLEDPRSDTDG